MDKVIISDTSCLIALSKIERLDLLKYLYHEIIITQDVFHEFGGPLPDWILITEVKDKQNQKELEIKLDKGEAGSLALALETDNSTLIIDEFKGRKIAQSLILKSLGQSELYCLPVKKD